MVFNSVRIQKEPEGSNQKHPLFVYAELQRLAFPVHVTTPCINKTTFKNRPSMYTPTFSCSIPKFPYILYRVFTKSYSYFQNALRYTKSRYKYSVFYAFFFLAT